MASNKTLVPEAKEALEKFKMEAASEVGVNLTQGYNGDLTSRQAGSVGGQMVKKMIDSYENSLKKKSARIRPGVVRKRCFLTAFCRFLIIFSFSILTFFLLNVN